MAQNVYVAYIVGATLNISDERFRSVPKGGQLIFMGTTKTLQLVVVETLKGEPKERISAKWYPCGGGTDTLGRKVTAFEGVNFTASQGSDGWYLDDGSESDSSKPTKEELDHLPRSSPTQ